MSQTTTTTYSASHRASYMRYQNKNQSRMRAYYVANKRRLSASAGRGMRPGNTQPRPARSRHRESYTRQKKKSTRVADSLSIA